MGQNTKFTDNNPDCPDYSSLKDYVADNYYFKELTEKVNELCDRIHNLEKLVPGLIGDKYITLHNGTPWYEPLKPPIKWHVDYSKPNTSSDTLNVYSYTEEGKRIEITIDFMDIKTITAV